MSPKTIRASKLKENTIQAVYGQMRVKMLSFEKSDNALSTSPKIVFEIACTTLMAELFAYLPFYVTSFFLYKSEIFTLLYQEENSI